MALILKEYSFVIPHDMETLVEFMGGPTTFESRLDLMVSMERINRNPICPLTASSVQTKYEPAKSRRKWGWYHNSDEHRVSIYLSFYRTDAKRPYLATSPILRLLISTITLANKPKVSNNHVVWLINSKYLDNLNSTTLTAIAQLQGCAVWDSRELRCWGHEFVATMEHHRNLSRRHPTRLPARFTVVSRSQHDHQW